jgi:hypothetical protein
MEFGLKMTAPLAKPIGGGQAGHWRLDYFAGQTSFYPRHFVAVGRQ